MSCDSSNDEFKLTEEYKYLLSHIRPLIDQLDKSRDAQLCLLWLSKLEQCASWERSYRNKILSELCKQVKSNCLRPPFNASPPNGPLLNVLCGDWKTRDWVVRECTEAEGSTEEAVSSSSQQSFRPVKNAHKYLGAIPSWKTGYCCSNVKSRSLKPCKDIVDHSECFAIQKAYQERAQSDQMVIERYQDIIKSLVSQQLKADVSPSRLKKLQSNYESKMADLMRALKRAQDENESLKNKVDCLSSEVDEISVLRNENEKLRQQVFDLETSNSLWEAKYKKAEEEKFSNLSDVVNKLNESEKRLKEKEKRCKSLEKKYEDSYRKFESECQARKKEREKEKLHAAEMASLEKLLGEKQAEIDCLKEQISNQSAHFEEEITSLKHQMEGNQSFESQDKKKIKSLKSKAKKLEKLREHMTVLFQSQLQQILAKKDFYIASLEMQLKMTHSESGGSTFAADFHNSLDEKVSNLEAQYRKILEDSEQQYIQRRQIDLQKIHSLEKQLLCLGGAVGDQESDLDQRGSSSVLGLVGNNNNNSNSNCGKTSQD